MSALEPKRTTAPSANNGKRRPRRRGMRERGDDHHQHLPGMRAKLASFGSCARMTPNAP